MFPIRDHNPSGRRPFVTYALIAGNIVIFVAYWSVLTSESQINQFFHTWGLVPGAILQGGSPATILTSMFLQGGWMHLIGNMWFLWIFGDNLEDEMGHAGFAGFYLLSGLAAAALHVAVDPGSMVPMVGASGAIAGVMGGYLLLFPKAKIDVLFIFVIFFRIFPIPAWIVLGVWIGLQLFSGASTPTEAASVAYWAHIGGFAGGLALTLPPLIKRGGRLFWSRTEGHPPNPAAVYTFAKTMIPKVPRR